MDIIEWFKFGSVPNIVRKYEAHSFHIVAWVISTNSTSALALDLTVVNCMIMANIIMELNDRIS